MPKGRKEEWELELHTNLLIHTAVFCEISDAKVEGTE